MRNREKTTSVPSIHWECVIYSICMVCGSMHYSRVILHVSTYSQSPRLVLIHYRHLTMHIPTGVLITCPERSTGVPMAAFFLKMPFALLGALNVKRACSRLFFVWGKWALDFLEALNVQRVSSRFFGQTWPLDFTLEIHLPDVVAICNT